MLKANRRILFISLAFLIPSFILPALLITSTYAEGVKESLFKACRKGEIESVKRFLDKGANVNSRDHSRNSLLGIAAKSGHLDLVKFLLDKGAEINGIDATNAVNRTPLMEACGVGHFEIVKLLVELGADSNLKNRNWETALALASSRGRVEIVQFLLENGADTKVEDRGGHTAFMVACTSGHLQVAKAFHIGEYSENIKTIVCSKPWF